MFYNDQICNETLSSFFSASDAIPLNLKKKINQTKINNDYLFHRETYPHRVCAKFSTKKTTRNDRTKSNESNKRFDRKQKKNWLK